MSTAGIHAMVYENGQAVESCLMVGGRVPKIHHSDGIPVYFVTTDDRGAATPCTDNVVRRLIAYPSGWPGPGLPGKRVIVGSHERLPWDAAIPLFDLEE